ncbi:MAG: 1-phosphofructokinase family hexose kinase, partial [Oscillospiraceae bacterium]|nr:1-phosphofructokinase family hexose kinase [Oscillospiraceae bacterium]
MIYTVTLNPSVDYSVFPTEFHAGEINRSEREVHSFGGKGINVSAMLANLGVESCALGFIGGFSGKEIERLATRAGIACDFIKTQDPSRINIKIISDTETAVNGKGPFIRIEEERELILKLSRLTEEDTVVVSGSAPESESGSLLENVLDAATCARLIVDMDGAALKYAIEKQPYLIKPNYDELCALFGKAEMRDNEIASAAAHLRRGGVKNVLVSLGGQGAVLASSDGNIYRVRAPHVDVISTVGAGDSFLAGFLAGEERGAQFALSLASAAGSATAACERIADAEV